MADIPGKEQSPKHSCRMSFWAGTQENERAGQCNEKLAQDPEGVGRNRERGA